MLCEFEYIIFRTLWPLWVNFSRFQIKQIDRFNVRAILERKISLIFTIIWLTWYRNKAVATRPFDVGPSNFHTMTSLGSYGAFWKKKLKNFSKFKMAAIFRSRMTKKFWDFVSTLNKRIFHEISWLQRKLMKNW